MSAAPITRQRVGVAPAAVTLAAFEVYTELSGEQPVLADGAPKGGFTTHELVALLYARGFPKSQWRSRFTEALHGLDVAWPQSSIATAFSSSGTIGATQLAAEQS